MMTFNFFKRHIPDVVLIESSIFSDSRGFFIEIFKSADFQQHGLPASFVQVSHSQSKKNVMRGLHYQLNPKAQARIIRVVRGEIFDVAVDIRRSSPTYGQWLAERLSSSNNKMLFIPEGFAHGYCVLSEVAEVLYFCTKEYAPDLERNILWNDPTIAISWPIKEPLLSDKDCRGSLLSSAENNF